MSRAIIYIREAEGLPARQEQQTSCEAIAKTLGLQVTATITAGPTRPGPQPGFDVVLDAATSAETDMIIAWSPDCVSRTDLRRLERDAPQVALTTFTRGSPPPRPLYLLPMAVLVASFAIATARLADETFSTWSPGQASAFGVCAAATPVIVATRAVWASREFPLPSRQRDSLLMYMLGWTFTGILLAAGYLFQLTHLPVTTVLSGVAISLTAPILTHASFLKTRLCHANHVVTARIQPFPSER